MSTLTTPAPAHSTRLLLRDGAVVAAFACLLISGQIPLWVSVLFGVGATAALSGRRLSRPAWGTWALLGAAGVLYTSAAVGTLDLVVAASSFAALLTLQRMHANPTPATDNQVLLTGLLMAAGGAALTAEVWFVPFLLAFMALGTFALAAGVLEQSARAAGEPTPLRAALPWLCSGLAITLAGAVFFFVVFPRLSWNMAARDNPWGATARSGFSGEVKLGEGGGTIKLDPRPVLRARLRPDPGKASLSGYWFGRALDTFDGISWRAQGHALAARHRVELQHRRGRPLEQEIEVLPPYGSSTLVALETPLGFESAVVRNGPLHTQPGIIQVVDEQVHLASPSATLTYLATSSPQTPGAPSQGSLSRYLNLPATLDKRVAQLAERVLGGESDPARAAARMTTYLQREYSYSLDLGPSASDPLADFLFVRRKGHCEHFATALAVLLRTQGIATRVATGFYGGVREEDTYLIRAADAHSWVQVFIPGTGFVTYDATPEDFRAGRPSPFFEWTARLYEALERHWRAQVVDYSFVDQARYARQTLNVWREHDSSPRGWRRGFGIAGWLTAGLLLLAGISRVVRARGQTRTSAAALLGTELARSLRNADFPLHGDEDLEAYLGRLVHSTHPLALTLPVLLRRYLQARFGTRPLMAGEATALLRRLRATLQSTPRPPRQGSPGL